MHSCAQNLLSASAVGFVMLVPMLTGCEPVRDPQGPNDTVAILSVYTDKHTGCQYIGQRNSSAGITPRIATDGKTHMGCTRSASRPDQIASDD